MSLQEMRYAIYWAFMGVAKPTKTLAFLRARRRVEHSAREAAPTRVEDLGSVSSLSILPLVDFYPGREGLLGEAGVSYLVTAGCLRILFDVGCNEHDEEPSPLRRNMDALDVSPGNIDAVFISHCHLDHVGGRRCQKEKTFAISKEPVDLRGIPAYVPTPMTHPSARMDFVAGPRRLGDGLASTGPLERAIWLMGPVAEQALVVNVQGRGPVMIVGCGHPQLPRLVERAQAVVGAPLYGIIGGLHFPVTASRVGKGRQNIIGNGKLPWQRISRSEARDAAAMLAALDLKVAVLSAHDSCDWTLRMFEEALGDRYRTMRVGEEIVIA
ncbi:MAG: MBL fold metallo-hydrolase [Actinobacteria bacterium]|nr:MBL fold metallo-hydrolase [Actinomycetota bacterium]